MTMDLTNGRNYLRFSRMIWANMLYLANQYGWQPQGTVLSDDTESGRWDGDYFGNEGQTITAEDANALADALEKALDDIPDREVYASLTTEVIDFVSADQLCELVLEHDYVLLGADPHLKKATIDKAGYLNPFVHLSGSYKLAVKDLIALCREGAFFIC